MNTIESNVMEMPKTANRMGRNTMAKLNIRMLNAIKRLYSCVIAWSLLINCVVAADAGTNFYHFDRVFEPVTNSPTPPTHYKVIMGARALTGIIGPTNICIRSNQTYANEYEGFAWGHESGIVAWTSVLAVYQNYYTNYPGAIYDNAGWIKGTRSSYGTAGAYIWLLQNTIAFTSSASSVYVSPGGATSVIASVLVGTLGDYCPQAFVSDTGPVFDTNYPGSNIGTDQVFKADLNAYYKLVPLSYLGVNDDDSDRDGIPDFADGYNQFGGMSYMSSNDYFVPWQLQLSGNVSVSVARIRFVYSASDPAGVAYSTNGYSPAIGAFRIWRKNGGEARMLNDYVAPDTYDATVFGYTESNRLVDLYLEPVGPTNRGSVIVEVDPDGAGPKGFVCQDRRMLTLFKVDIAIDGNRDDEIKFDDPGDAKYLFWVNSDHDERTYLQKELTWVEDDLGGDPDCDNDYIGFKSGIGSSCKRDLEDFTRLHIRVDDTTANLPGMTYHLKFENSTDNPAVNVFEAVGESSAYLSQVSVADSQIEKTRLLTVDATERPLSSQYIKVGNQVSPFILEGKHKGTGDLTLIVKKDGSEVCRKSVRLELHDMPWFYDVYTVTATGERWESGVSQTASPRSPAAGYSPATDEKVLLVHGWNMTDSEKTQWVETTFKRLWWQGYQGSVAAFNWPTLADFGFWDILSGGRHFDNSEFRSWLSAHALVGVFNTLNAGGKLRVLAHSMGNVVVGEAIHQYSGANLHTYLACQAALAGHYYDNTNSVLSSPDTPNIMGHFSNAVDDAAYLVGNASKVTKRVNYHNEDDWALDLWESNNGLKPDNVTPYFFWYDGRTTQYEEGVDRFVRGVVGDIWNVYSVNTAHDLWTILSYIAESRSKALGQTPVASGQFGSWDLKSEMLYDDEHYSHSKEFRSTIPEQWKFWEQVRKDCNFVSTHPTP